MPTPASRGRRNRARRNAATLLLAATALTLAACTTSPQAPETAKPSGDGTTWPTPVDPAHVDEVWVVWTAVADAGDDGAVAGLQAEVDRLAALGFETSPWDPACQENAGELLTGLTGYAEVVGVGVAFGSAEDAGGFDTLDDGPTVSLTGGAYTC